MWRRLDRSAAREDDRPVNHKRKRPKSRRAGCLLCKPHKANGTKGTRDAQTRQEQRGRASEREQKAEQC